MATARAQPAICVWRTHHLHHRERGGGEDTAMWAARPPRSTHTQSSAASDVYKRQTRQGASAFNQALSFDMSRVTNTNGMFYVRSARALPPSLESVHPHARRVRCRRPTPSHPASYIPSFRLGRGARAGSSSGCREAAPRQALRIEALTEVCVTVGRVYGDCSTT